MSAYQTPAHRLLAELAERTESRGRSGELLIGLVGDVHGQHKRPALELFCREAQPDILLQVGDLQDYRGGYMAPMVFVRGNHECWPVLDEMAAGEREPKGLAQIFEGVPLSLSGLRIAAAGGCWSSSGKQGRKNLTAAQVSELLRHHADIVLSHETPIHFSNGHQSKTLEPLREACELMSPRIWASGHHHHWDREQLGRTTILSLGKWPDEWATVTVDRKGRLSGPERFRPSNPQYAELKAHWRAGEAEEKSILFGIDRKGGRYGTNEPGAPSYRQRHLRL